jgi:hypothetical protein
VRGPPVDRSLSSKLLNLNLVSLLLYSWPRGKQWSIKINYLYVLTDPLKRKFHAYFKNDLKEFYIIINIRRV